MSPPKVGREGEVVEREEGGEEEEGEVKRAKVEREKRGEEEGESEFTSFDYLGTNYTDFAQSKRM